jgi:dTMP kinase
MAFIVVEGLDGAGTTTQCDLLAAALRQRGLVVHQTREPTDGPIGRLIRCFLTGSLTLDPATVALLFAADRVEHLRNDVRPALATGSVVISDRYVLSSLAYQSIDVPIEWVASLNQRATPPDLTVFLDVPPEVCAARLARRGQPAEHYETLDRLHAVATAYRRALDATRLAGGRVHVVDGQPGPATVHEAVLTAALSVIMERGSRRL